MSVSDDPIAGMDEGEDAVLAQQNDEAAEWARSWKLARAPELIWTGPPRVSTFSEQMICFDWERQIDFSHRPWWPRIYDSEFTKVHLGPDGEYLHPKRTTFLLCSRQVEKSTWMGTTSLAVCAMLPNVCVLYVSSALDNASEFADERIENPLRNSPNLERYMNTKLSMNRFGKRFSNNSRIVIRAVKKDAKRVRGIPADLVRVDELQDVNGDFLPDVFAATKNSELPGGAIYGLAGTPLGHDNITAVTWKESTTQNVWLTRCPRCRHWNPPYLAQVGRHGMICEKCSRAINPLEGQWVRGVSDPQALASPRISMEGFHLSQVMQPYTVFHRPQLFEDRWRTLINDIHSPMWSEAKVQNEIIGLPWDSGSKPVSLEEVEACCAEGLYLQRQLPAEVRSNPNWPVFAGVDWGEGNPGGSYSVVHLGWLNGKNALNGKPMVGYAKRYEGPEAAADYIKKDLVDLFAKNKVALAFVDARHGWGMMDYLWEKVPDGRNRIILVDYSDSIKTLGTVNAKEMRMTINRTRWMSRVFSMIKQGRIILPNWKQYQTPFGRDILNIFADRSPRRNQMVYKHSSTDDCFHSLSYMILAIMYYYGGEADFLTA